MLPSPPGTTAADAVVPWFGTMGHCVVVEILTLVVFAFFPWYEILDRLSHYVSKHTPSVVTSTDRARVPSPRS